MKTFVLFALTLCIAQCEMSRKLFTERGQRSKSKLDHHRPGVAGAGRSFLHFFHKKFGHHKALPDFRSSNRIARSLAFKEHGSGYIEYIVGNTAGTDLTFGSGSSSGLGSGFGSGFGSGASLTVPISLTSGIKTEESQTERISSITQTPSHESRKKSESSNSNGGIINVLTSPGRKRRSVVELYPGSGDTGSGSSSGEVYTIGGEQEGSGSDIIEEVIIDSRVAQIQYTQGSIRSVATSIGSGGGIACIGAGCDQGSGSIEIHEEQVRLTHSSVQRNSVPGEDFLGSGMYAGTHEA